MDKGLCEDNQVARDLFDTRLMGVLTPFPHEVRARFRALYAQSPRQATDWFYRFSQDTNYIRRDRIARDRKWQYQSPYGALDITINLSKPEKDPRDIALALQRPSAGYPPAGSGFARWRPHGCSRCRGKADRTNPWPPGDRPPGSFAKTCG